MSRLKVLLRGALISEIELNPEKEYTGGRKEGLDIRLQAEKGISREHFKMKMQDGQWHLQAISRFGEVFSLGRKIEEIALEHGQSFQIPPYEFQFVDVPDSENISISEEQRNIEINENERTVLGAAPQVPYIKMVNTLGEVTEMLRLELGELWVAGRDPSCQIVIADQRVSRRQFEIHKVNGIYTILDLASVNGTFLNGSPVSSTDPQTLKSGDAISVLDNTLYFELHDPNFKFKLEKIEIPVLNFDQPPQEEYLNESADFGQANSQFPSEIPTIEQNDFASPQFETGSSPFTGIPNQEQSNQFYSFNSAPPEKPPTPWEKFKKNKPLMIATVLLILGAAFWVSESLNTEEAVKAPTQATESDAFSKLTAKQQSEIKELYSLADQMMSQQKYDLALEKIRKIHEILPTGYKESKAMQMQAEQSLLTIVQQQEDEKRQREEEEQKKKFAEIASKCEKLITPKVEMDVIKQCLFPIAAIDPTNSEYVRIVADAEKVITDRKIKESDAKSLADQAIQLKEMFKKAEKIQNEGFAFKAIKQYQAVKSSSLADPTGLKAKATQRIEFIKQKIEEKTVKSVSEAEKLFQDGKIKFAIILLRESLVYDPDNQKVKEKMESYTRELRRQMMVIYQESVIDESYGIVESTEARSGAKEKWKKIIELDLEDGEYYKKAIIKLRKYGIV